MNKIYNFSPGPSKINEGVIKEVQKSIENYKDTGKSVLEISHRSKDFDEILEGINQNFQTLFGLPDDFKVLLLQGGATFQNSLIPLNIGIENSIGCLVNGTWGQKTYEDFFVTFTVCPGPQGGADLQGGVNKFNTINKKAIKTMDFYDFRVLIFGGGADLRGPPNY